MINKRRYDLDWLRIIAFTILIYFHTAIIFIPDGIPLIQNNETSAILDWFVSISHQFRLALLFFISGIGVAFAKQRRSTREFINERSKRLLIPLIIGILIVVPITVYTEKVFLDEITNSFWTFYPRFFTEGIYPYGNLSWHHFWFIAYLYLFCLLGTKVFNKLHANSGQLLNSFTKHSEGYGIYKMVLPLFIIEVSLRAIFPGFRDLVTDWASFFHWFTIFVAGYITAHDINILRNAEKLRYQSLLIAISSCLLLYHLFYENLEIQLSIDTDNIIIKYIAYCAIRMILVWSCILTCLGFAGHHLNFSTRISSYLNEAVYPLFILHLTIIVILSYFVVEWDTNLWLKYFVITTATIFAVLGIYHVAIRPFNSMRMLFGVKQKS